MTQLHQNMLELLRNAYTAINAQDEGEEGTWQRLVNAIDEHVHQALKQAVMQSLMDLLAAIVGEENTRVTPYFALQVRCLRIKRRPLARPTHQGASFHDLSC